jgi:hypothetical protein
VKSAYNIRIRGLVKADVAVADLNEVKLSSDLFRVLAKSLGTQNAATDSPKDASAGPSHAFEKSSTVDAVTIVVVSYQSLHVSSSIRANGPALRDT